MGKMETWEYEVKQAPLAVNEVRSGLRRVEEESVVAMKITCQCGSPMIKRKNSEGKLFWGCTTFPKCRHTRAI
jgi:restriction system protein